MTDISKCSGEGCEQKEKCYRFTTIADEQWQSYFTEPPIKDGKCEYFWTNNNYKIIIPKEELTEEAKQRAKNYMSLKGALEPKQENCCTPIGQIKRYVDCKGCDKKPKQETLEEVIDLNYWRSNAEEDYLQVPISVLRYISELEKQQERMYSEEEVQNLIKIIEWYDDNSDVRPNCDKEIDGLTMWDWFEQFKKKQQ